jgi:hypothetical protein
MVLAKKIEAGMLLKATLALVTAQDPTERTKLKEVGAAIATAMES